jgi:predicted Ser/Thr protein kinase
VCGVETPADAPAGACPSCLFRLGFSADSSRRAGRFIPPPPATLSLLFADLEVQSLVGVGGMGAVYRARQLQLDRTVAVKVMHRGGGAGDPAFDERFIREARALARLRHPGVVTVFDAGQADNYLYIVMEFVEGASLRELIDDGVLSRAEAVRIVGQICQALQYAHQCGVVHRDIKPENVLVDSTGQARLIDFGVARVLHDSAVESTPSPLPKTISSASRSPTTVDADLTNAKLAEAELTEADHRLGTARYMAPEQVKSPADVDHRADIYSLGVMFYEMLTGHTPGPSSARGEVGRSDVARRKPDRPLSEVIRRSMAERPADRFQTATDMSRALASLSRDGVVRRSVVGRWVAAAAVLALLIGGAIQFWPATGDRSQSSAATRPADVPLPGKSVLRSLNPMVDPGNLVLMLDGTSSHIAIPTLSRDQDRPVTVEAWIRPLQQSTRRPKAVVVLGGRVRCQLNHNPDGLGGYDQSLAGAEIFAPPETAGQRHPTRGFHIAFVIDNDEGRLYLDGQLVGRHPRIGPRFVEPVEVKATWIGAHPEAPDGSMRYHFRGWVDEIRISDGARYTTTFAPSVRFNADPATLALYHCDEGNGQLLYDASGNGHHGKVSNVTWTSADALWPVQGRPATTSPATSQPVADPASGPSTGPSFSGYGAASVRRDH